MKSPSSDRSGILILHIWQEGDDSDGFRARITQTFDSISLDKQIASASSPEGIYKVVRTWVEAFVNPN